MQYCASVQARLQLSLQIQLFSIVCRAHVTLHSVQCSVSQLYKALCLTVVFSVVQCCTTLYSTVDHYRDVQCCDSVNCKLHGLSLVMLRPVQQCTDPPCTIQCSQKQYITVQCGVLQCMAVYCSARQCIAVHSSVLQCTAVYCSALQCIAVQCGVLLSLVDQCNVV